MMGKGIKLAFEVLSICFAVTVFIPVMAGLASCKGVAETAPPAELEVVELRDVSAVLKWSGTAASYEIIVGEIELGPDLEGVSFAGKTFTVTGLSPETQYAWRVRSVDGGKYSAWADGPPFETTIAAPTELEFSEVYGTSARLSWEGSAEFYEVLMDTQIRTVAGTTTVIYDLSGATRYSWNVRSVDGERRSNWVRGPQFITQATADTHSYTYGNLLHYTEERGSDDLRNWYVYLYETDYERGKDVFLCLDLYAPGRYNVMSDGTYTPGKTYTDIKEWTIGKFYSGLARYPDGGGLWIDEFDTGSVEVTYLSGDEYRIAIDLVTVRGTIIKCTYTGLLPPEIMTDSDDRRGARR